MKQEMRSDCLMCELSSLRVLISIAAMFNWRCTRVGIKNAFIKTGYAAAHVYVVPKRESDGKNLFLWLLNEAA